METTTTIKTYTIAKTIKTTGNSCMGFTRALCSESDGGGGVNLKCIDVYAVLEWENDTKFHVFATKHKANT